MKVNELRIGNFVNAHLYKNDLILVESICSKNDEIFNSTTGEIPLTSVEPIPLTEEWLIRFGFIKNKSDIRYWSFGSLKVKITENGFKFKYTTSIRYIKYVHQIQNLYFALTGTELTLNQ